MAIRALGATSLLAASLFVSSSGGATERASGLEAPVLAATAIGDSREPRRAEIVQDGAAVKGVGEQDSRIAEYIEMHERATDSSGRASLMPWSALKQIAN